MEDIVFSPDVLTEVHPSEASSLKKIMDELIVNDSRFVGLATYIVNVRIFWSAQIETACAGHGFIFFNPNFYNRIPPETRITVMAHEIWHLILKHLGRTQDQDPYFSNIAQDHVINIPLSDDGFTFHGTDPFMDFQYRGMSSEEVYNHIYTKRKEENKPPTLAEMNGHISGDTIEGLIEAVLGDDQQGKSLEDQKKDAAKDVENFHKAAGTVTGNNLIELECTRKIVAIKDATYDQIFANYMIEPLSGGKRTFMRPNRRQHAVVNQNLRLPGRFHRKGPKNRLTHLVYALDVSGSINAYQAQQFHDSVRTIKEMLNPEYLTVIFFDTKIKKRQTFTDKQTYKNIQVSAGGSTSLIDVWKAVADINPEALVIFTDLYVNIPPKPDWDCIWLLPDINHAPISPDHYGPVYLIP